MRLLDRVMSDQILSEIRKFTRLPRQHASFYNRHDKGIKESGIVGYFLDKKNHKNIHQFVSFNVPKQDPPDAWLIDKEQNQTALEITELVNQNAIDAQINNLPEYWAECEKWADLNYFESELNDRILDKQKKCSALFEQEVSVHLLLHTDEVWLKSCYEEHLRNGATICQNSFSIIWLLLSYSPLAQSSPVIKLWKNDNNTI